MFFLLPYRVKNPIKYFPYATLSLIIANFIVYFCTNEDLLHLPKYTVHHYGFALAITPFYTIFSSMFLHQGPVHLLGNMFFLWIFGPPIEDRLRIPKYLLIYFSSGIAGGLLQGVMDQGFLFHAQYLVGASGCILGVLGAYLYIFPWSKVLIAYFYWFIRPGIGVWETPSYVWILLYLLMNLFSGVLGGLLGSKGGVAAFDHVGGMLMGAVFCLALRIKRDSEAVSEAKAYHADDKDLTNLPLHILETMHEQDPTNAAIVSAMIPQAMRLGQQPMIDKLIADFGPNLINDEPLLVAHYLLDLHGSNAQYGPVHLLRLAGLLEKNIEPSRAVNVYRMIVDQNPTSPDAETALYRMALCYWNSFKDATGTRQYLTELQTKFPHGEMTAFAKTLWQKTGG